MLGYGFECLPLSLPSGDNATLVRYTPHLDTDSGEGTWEGRATSALGALEGAAVLYIHGWSDYFYHRDLARFWAGLGAAFYAVDLRNYGRNLNLSDPERRPGYIEDLDDYGEEIAESLAVIRTEHPGCRVIINAHSTGGLTACLWANDHPGEVAALVLNSPWLEFQYSTGMRMLLGPLLGARAGGAPLKLLLPHYYTLAVAQAHGNAPFDLRLKPPESFPVYPQFLRAVFAGHQRVMEGLDIRAAVLVQMSKTSVQAVNYTPEMAHADVVLDVRVLAERAIGLADSVVVDRVPGAMHDIYLSDTRVRDEAFRRIAQFVRGYL